MQDEERAWPRYELIDGELLGTPSPIRATPMAASRVEHAHPARDPAAQQLIEQVYVDLAELPAQIVGRLCHMR